MLVSTGCASGGRNIDQLSDCGHRWPIPGVARLGLVVHPRGPGLRLSWVALMGVCEDWAVVHGYDGVTLRTHRNVPWKARTTSGSDGMGFRKGELGPELRGLRPYECELGFEVQSWLEWSMEANAAGQIVHEWNLDGAAFTGAVAGAHAVAADLTYIYDPAGRRTVQTTRRTLESTVTESVTNHYADDSDSPAWVTSSTVQGLSSTVYVGLLTGSDVSLLLTTSGGVTSGELALANPRGDVSATITLPAGQHEATGLDRWTRYTEYGTPIVTPPTGAGGAAANGYGWLGAKQRTTTQTGILLMGARLYNPVTGLFTSLDPIYGGNDTPYAYPNDPINKQDTSGERGWWARAAKFLGKVSDAAAWIPGLGQTVSTVAGYASAYAHLRAGNRREARSRAISTTMGFFGGGLSAKQLAEASPGGSCVNAVSYTHLTLPTNREV